jgi:hypothetical protein
MAAAPMGPVTLKPGPASAGERRSIRCLALRFNASANASCSAQIGSPVLGITRSALRLFFP